MKWTKGTFSISDQRDKVDIDVVAELLRETYWGKARPRHIVEKLVESSLCFSLYHNTTQIGFGRIVTDFTVFSWLDDLVIASDFRCRGLGQWLVNCILSNPDIEKTQFVLQTRMAHTFYERFDFSSRRDLMTRLPVP